MENYIIRIYRRDSNDPQYIAGMVELIDMDQKKPFSNFNELQNILASKKEENLAVRKKKGKVQ